MKPTLSPTRFSLACATICAAFFSHASALTVKVEPAPGTYHEAVEIRLTADDSNAKISYGFEPNGNPGSLHSYTGPVVLTGSTPLVWLAIGPDGAESPISIENYTIDYRNTLAFIGGKTDGKKVYGIGVKNISNDSVSLRGWSVVAGNTGASLPLARLAPGAAVSVLPVNYDGQSDLRLVSPAGNALATITAAELPTHVAYLPGSAVVASLLDSGAGMATLAALLILALALTALARIPAFRRKVLRPTFVSFQRLLSHTKKS